MNNNPMFANYEAGCLLGQIQAGCFDETGIFDNEEEKNNEMLLLQSVKDVNDFFKSKVYKVNNDVERMVVEKLAGKNEANTASKCPRCGSDRFKISAQRRSSDEPMNHEIHCPSCRLVEYK